MSKWASSLVADQGLSHLRDNCTSIIACQGQPANYAEATTPVASGKLLGSLGALTPAEWVLGNDPGSGRRATLATQTLQIGYAGTFNHVALVDDVNQVLLYVLPVTIAQAVVGGNTVTTPDIPITIQDPT